MDSKTLLLLGLAIGAYFLFVKPQTATAAAAPTALPPVPPGMQWAGDGAGHFVLVPVGTIVN